MSVVGEIRRLNLLPSRLCRALGLDAAKVEKFALVCDRDDLIRVYAVMLPEAAQLEKLCDEIEVIRVADVEVDDQCNVRVVHEKPPSGLPFVGDPWPGGDVIHIPNGGRPLR